MARTAPVDMTLLRTGLLMLPDGHLLCGIDGLERIAADIDRFRVTMLWADVPHGQLGLCHRESRTLLIDPEIWTLSYWEIRAVITHELGHVIVGPDDDDVIAWQIYRYGDLVLEPMDLTA
jgi:hypothetical protein